MTTRSLNDSVYYQVTKSGRRIMVEKLDALYATVSDTSSTWRPNLQCPWRTDVIDGHPIEWYKSQLHNVLQEFGGRSFVGRMLPITDITFDEPPPVSKEERSMGEKEPLDDPCVTHWVCEECYAQLLDVRHRCMEQARMTTPTPIPFTLDIRDDTADYTIRGTYTPGTPSTYHLNPRDPAYDPIEFDITSVYLTDVIDPLEDYIGDLTNIIKDSILDRLETAVYDALIRRSKGAV